MVLIIGGGISGLTAAYDLARAGVPFRLLEAQPRAGGLIETRDFAGCRLEAGPESFLSTKPAAVELARELGLGARLMGSNDHARVTYIWRGGRLIPMPRGLNLMVPTDLAALRESELLSESGKQAVLADLDWKPSAIPERSVAEFVTDHFGAEALDYLAEPLLAGVYGGDPEELSAVSVFPRFVELERTHGSLIRGLEQERRPAPAGSIFQSLRGGLSELIDALAARVGDRIIPQRADTVERTEAGFRVRAGGQWMEASRLILAVPAWASAALLTDLDPELSRLLCEIPYTPSLTLALVYRRERFDGATNGFGFLVPKRERDRIMAATWIGTKWDHRVPDDRVAIRVFFGGKGEEAILNEGDEALVAIARAELRKFMGVTAEPLDAMIGRWPRSMPQYTIGHAARVTEIEKRCEAIAGLRIIGNAYHGIGIPDSIRLARAAARGETERTPS
ncbi:MAG: protoporphyrinogen oxidase [Bryobacteraceae bacterium]|nr:protoporphyrinogen oxidase [Bryobacteraceae bacterium]